MKNALITTLIFLICDQIAFCQNVDKNQSVKPETVLEVGYDYGGCELCGVWILKINKDSIFYIKGSYSKKTASFTNRTEHLKTDTSEWKKLLQLIDLKEFDLAPKGRNERETDGIDTQVYIKTLTKTHRTIIDYPTLKHYKSLDSLLINLQNQIKLLDINATISK